MFAQEEIDERQKIKFSSFCFFRDTYQLFLEEQVE
jgi:hypothetical protein